MAQLTVLIRDQHLARVLDAFGRQGVPATQAEVEKELQDYCKHRVKKSETIEAADKKRGQIEKESW